jgi:hypothetical protein
VNQRALDGARFPTMEIVMASIHALVTGVLCARPRAARVEINRQGIHDGEIRATMRTGPNG